MFIANTVYLRSFEPLGMVIKKKRALGWMAFIL